jgi:hypothetical protein
MKLPTKTTTATASLLIAFAFLPTLQAVFPPPDGGYAGGNTAVGASALLSLTTGTFNTAAGLFSLMSNTEGQFNTAIGAGTLLGNTADQNTAVGAGALLSNTTGTENTANGTFALFSNTSGFGNTAIGSNALFSNTTGGTLGTRKASKWALIQRWAQKRLRAILPAALTRRWVIKRLAVLPPEPLAQISALTLLSAFKLSPTPLEALSIARLATKRCLTTPMAFRISDCDRETTGFENPEDKRSNPTQETCAANR